MIQGPNVKNQKGIVDYKVVDNLRDITLILKNGSTKKFNVDNKLYILLNTNIMLLLTSILEGNADAKLTNDIYRSCEFSILINRLRQIFNK